MARVIWPVGTSRMRAVSEASRYPAAPGWIFAFRAWVMSGGSHPISSSRPTAIRRSARCSLMTKLGLASTKWGSW